jgi:ketosteroid isomerase-like protein
MELWEVTARESIRDLTTRYNSNGDAGRFANVRDLFHEDAVMDLEGEVKTGLDEIMTIFSGTQSKLHGTDAATHASTDAPSTSDAHKEKAALPYVRHFTATHQIDLVDENNATGRLYFFVVTPIGPDHWGRYTDMYRKNAVGQWKFARRHVKVDGRSADSLFGGM